MIEDRKYNMYVAARLASEAEGLSDKERRAMIAVLDKLDAATGNEYYVKWLEDLAAGRVDYYRNSLHVYFTAMGDIGSGPSWL